MELLQQLPPLAVFKHFVDINQIPRPSSGEKAVSDFILNFATGLGLKVHQDSMHNLIIYKPGTAGKENNPPVILQAHLDMVWEKNADTQFDFDKQGIDMYVDGDLIRARGTTLGADNGLGTAMTMALLEATDIPHPPLEVLLTTEEETGMGGAMALDTSLLAGRKMINLDNSEESKIIMGCAAGAGISYRIPSKLQASPPSAAAVEITISGLMGGHSGGDIEKERANAIVLLAQTLSAVNDTIPIYLSAIKGGMKVNAIPREAVATIVTNSLDKTLAKLEELQQNIITKYRASDKDIKISHKLIDLPTTVLANTHGVLASICLMPAGPLSFSKEIEGLVTASNNPGVIKTTHDAVIITAMARGAAAFYNKETELKIAQLAKLTGAEVQFDDRSPAWPYNPDSELLKIAEKLYTPIFGQAPNVTAIHAGLECGLFAEKIPGLDIIAIGPENKDLHTPDERLSIASTEKMWQFLKDLLQAI